MEEFKTPWSTCWTIFMACCMVSGVYSMQDKQLAARVDTTEVISNSVTSGISERVSHNNRQRRGVNTLSADDIQTCLDKHNTLRKDEGAADMRHMVWDTDLANMAQQWAEACDFVHGQPGSHPTYSQLGQNLYLTTGSIDIGAGIQAWFDEKSDFTYSSNQCVPGKVCGHYTQVVWAESFLLGCGVHQCTPLIDSETNDEWASANYLVCNYAPGGNDGSKPFTQGSACTKCSTGVFNCSPDGLCVDDCSSIDCECKACEACQNCAEIKDTCSCDCKDGYTGVDCSATCEDTDAKCNANPGWPPSWCTDEYSYVLDGCPLMCGLCTEGTGESVGECNNGCDNTGTGDGTTESTATHLTATTALILTLCIHSLY